jgi:phenylacetate-coenzyme A ligase PaaK-like adenylate-forming protein
LGRIFVSLLDNPWVAILRFDVGDLVRLADKPCPCGRTAGLTVAAIEGRARDLTFAADGRAVAVGELDRAVGDVHGLLAYQVEQSRAGEYTFRFVAEPDAEASACAAALTRLQTLYGETARIVARRDSAIGAEQSGKFRLARTLFAWDAETLFEAGGRTR